MVIYLTQKLRPAAVCSRPEQTSERPACTSAPPTLHHCHFHHLQQGKTGNRSVKRERSGSQEPGRVSEWRDNKREVESLLLRHTLCHTPTTPIDNCSNQNNRHFIYNSPPPPPFFFDYRIPSTLGNSQYTSIKHILNRCIQHCQLRMMGVVDQAKNVHINQTIQYRLLVVLSIKIQSTPRYIAGMGYICMVLVVDSVEGT